MGKPYYHTPTEAEPLPSGVRTEGVNKATRFKPETAGQPTQARLFTCEVVA